MFQYKQVSFTNRTRLRYSWMKRWKDEKIDYNLITWSKCFYVFIKRTNVSLLGGLTSCAELYSYFYPGLYSLSLEFILDIFMVILFYFVAPNTVTFIGCNCHCQFCVNICIFREHKHEKLCFKKLVYAFVKAAAHFFDHSKQKTLLILKICCNRYVHFVEALTRLPTLI